MRTGGVRLRFTRLVRLSWRMTNGVPFPSLGTSLLYENEDLKEGSIPTVTPIEQVRDEGNCGEVTNRGEEACECAVKLTSNCRRQPHSRQICEVTDRNLIQGRCGQASEPSITKHAPEENAVFIRIGKSGCAPHGRKSLRRESHTSYPGRSVARICHAGLPANRTAIGHGDQTRDQS